MGNANIELVKRWFAIGAEASAAGDPEPLRGLIHSEFEFAPHITGGHEGVTFHGYDGFVRFVSMQAETWESLRAEPVGDTRARRRGCRSRDTARTRTRKWR